MKKAKPLAARFDHIADYVLEPNALRDLAGKLFDVAVQSKLFDETGEALDEFCEEWNVPDKSFGDYDHPFEPTLYDEGSDEDHCSICSDTRGAHEG